MAFKKLPTINGIHIYPFSSIDEILDFVDDKKQMLIAVNALKITNADIEMRRIINANIGYADGFGVVFGMKRKGYKNAVKIPGCELWLKIIERYQSFKSFYFIGGRDSVVEATVNKLKSEYRMLNIVGYHNGYFDSDGKSRIISEIQDKKPDVVMVAMGSPRQESLMGELLRFHPALYMGLGGSYDVYVGNVDRAPKWWVDHNLEFAYRLLKQPFRIKRQLALLKYAICVLLKIY